MAEVQYFATLVKGTNYGVAGHIFSRDVEAPVSKELYQILKGLSEFTVRKGDDKPAEPTKTDTPTGDGKATTPPQA